MKKLFAVLFALCVPLIAHADTYERYMLFNGSNQDSTEHASRWIPVRGANRITIRTWTTKAAWSATPASDTDSLFTDSIATFKVAWSDSVSFIARDSAGTIVPVNRNGGSTDNSFPICADSISFTLASNGYQDSSITMTAMTRAPANVDLRAPTTGSGRVATIAPIAPGSISTYGDGAIVKQYMRVLITPVRRMTQATLGAVGCPAGPCGTRVNGLKGLKMEVLVWRD